MTSKYSSKVTDETGTSSQLPPLRPPNSSLTHPERTPTPNAHSVVRDSSRQGYEIEGVYIISVAARILDMHPQTLRKYERLGLISPDRTVGMLRLYSREDIRKILLIRHLMDNLGLNLAGVEFALALVDNLLGLKERLSAAEGTSMKAVVEQELSLLFRNLNLPLEK